MFKKQKKYDEPIIKKNNPEMFKWCSCHINRSHRNLKPDICYNNCNSITLSSNSITLSSNSITPYES